MAGLIWFAAVRAAQSPLVVGMGAVVAVVTAAGLWRTMTVWVSASASISVGAASVGFGGLVVAANAVLRECQREFSELLDCAEVGRSSRLVALVLGSVCGVGLISGLVTACLLAVGSMDIVPIGQVGWSDLTSDWAAQGSSLPATR